MLLVWGPVSRGVNCVIAPAHGRRRRGLELEMHPGHTARSTTRTKQEETAADTPLAQQKAYLRYMAVPAPGLHSTRALQHSTQPRSAAANQHRVQTNTEDSGIKRWRDESWQQRSGRGTDI